MNYTSHNNSNQNNRISIISSIQSATTLNLKSPKFQLHSNKISPQTSNVSNKFRMNNNNNNHENNALSSMISDNNNNNYINNNTGNNNDNNQVIDEIEMSPIEDLINCFEKIINFVFYFISRIFFESLIIKSVKKTHKYFYVINYI